MANWRALVAVVAAVLAAVTLTACVRIATHEAGAPADQRYDSRQAGVGNAAYTDLESDSGVPDFAGTGFARARYTGTPTPPPTPSQAYGSFSVEESEGSYGAAFYFPPGTLSGASPDQQAEVDIMRWEGPSTFGGIRIGSDHRARLIRGNLGTGTTEQIGESFPLQEGCWNWLQVAQKLRNTSWVDPGHATSKVRLNGRTMVDSHRPNRYGSAGTAASVRFGIPYIDDDAQGSASFSFYVDDAIASRGMGFFNPPNTCTPPPPPRPNILFIVTDDQRADDTLHQMPETMNWFRDGTVEAGDVIPGGTQFDEAYATTPLCCPARGSILTGNYAHNHGLRRNDEVEGLEDDAQIQALLKAGGYRTGIAGKYLNQWNTYADPPGFDKWWVLSPGYQPYANDNGTITPHPHPNDTTTYSTNYIRTKAKSFIDEMEANDSDPWFLYLAPNAPHSTEPFPYTEMTDPDPLWPWRPAVFTPPPAPDYPSRSEGAPGGDPITDKPLWVQEATDTTQYFAGGTSPAGGPLRDQQLRSLRSVDAMVSDVFRKLKARGEDRDTFAVFISDHGQMWREHGVMNNEFGPDGCERDPIPNTQPVQYVYRHCGLIQKDKPYTESIKVPLAMRWPANPAVQTGKVDISRYVANIDLAPTALSVAGLGAQAGQMDGRSLLDPSGARSEILTEDWETEAGTWASLRGRDATRRYHYIEYYKQDGSTLDDEQSDTLAEQPYLREYYDLNQDPYELTNLFRDGNPSTPDAAFVAQLSDRLRRARLCEATNCPPNTPAASVADTKPPRVTFEFPAPGVLVDGLVLPLADASDNVGVDRIVYTRPGQSDSTATRPGWAPAQWNTTLVGTGPQTLRATAYDKAGNSSFVEVTVNVQRNFDVRALNSGAGGSQRGLIEEGDTVTYQFDRAIAPGTVAPGWNGSAMTVTARIAPDHPSQRYNDVLTVDGVPSLGTIDLARDDFWGWRFTPPGQSPLSDEHALFTSSQLSMSADQKSVTLGLQGQTQTMPGPVAAVERKMIWTPSTSICSIVTPCKLWEVKTPGEQEFPDF